MIKELTLTPAILASTLTPCPKCGAERLQIKQWLTTEEFARHMEGETVEYHHSLHCVRCGYDERGKVDGPATVEQEQRYGYRSKVE